MDFGLAYSVEPTRAALRGPSTALTQARIPKTTAFYTRFPYSFRIREFARITPPSSTQGTFKVVIISSVCHYAVEGLKFPYEGAPDTSQSY
ncbi:hypothetical protein V3C99_008137 [Haemonchus contortus]